MWSTASGRRPLAGVLAGGLEVDVPEPAQLALADRRNRAGCRRARAPPGCPARPARRAWRNGCVEQLLARGRASPRHRRPSADRADRGAVGDVVGVREALLLAVDDDVDVALPPARHRLGAVRARPARSRGPAAASRTPMRDGLVDGELDELDAAAGRARRQRGKPGDAARPWPARSSSSRKISERWPSTATLRAEPARKLVVEDLQREQRRRSPWPAAPP